MLRDKSSCNAVTEYSWSGPAALIKGLRILLMCEHVVLLYHILVTVI